MGLNCMGPLICGVLFSIVNTTVLHDPWLVESTDGEEPLMQKSDYKLYIGL